MELPRPFHFLAQKLSRDFETLGPGLAEKRDFIREFQKIISTPFFVKMSLEYWKKHVKYGLKMLFLAETRC